MVAVADYDAGGAAPDREPAAVDRSGIVWAFGTDVSGADPYEGRPHPIADVPPSLTVALVYLTWCAILRSGAVWCWGSRYGLGRNPELSEWGPPFPPGPVYDLPERATALAGVGPGFVVLGESGALYRWSSEELPTRVAAPPADTFCARDRHSLCYVAAGVAVCSGESSISGVADAGFTPVELSDVVGVACAGTMTCAWLSDASTWCWGAPPPGSFADLVLAPVRMALPPVASISGGSHHMCAITEDGRVFCWGGLVLDFLGLGGLRNMSPVEVRMP